MVSPDRSELRSHQEDRQLTVNVITLNREELQTSPDPENASPEYLIQYNYYQNLSRIDNLKGFGIFSYEAGRSISLFFEDRPSAKTGGDYIQAMDAWRMYAEEMHRLDPELEVISVGGIVTVGERFDEAIEYHSKDHPEKWVGEEEVARAMSGGIEDEKETLNILLKAFKGGLSGKMFEPPTFVKFV